MDKRLKLEDACRNTLAKAYYMMTAYKWSQFDAYSYAEDLLQGISLSLWALELYDALDIVRYYKKIAFNRKYKES